MTEDGAAYERRSAVPVIAPVRPRKLAKVPFVELAEGRLQGVVSSGSDPSRVYVSSIAAREHGLSCNTNNNRPCGGLGGTHPCNHIGALIDAAVAQYGLDRVARCLKADLPEGGQDLRAGCTRPPRPPGPPRCSAASCATWPISSCPRAPIRCPSCSGSPPPGR